MSANIYYKPNVVKRGKNGHCILIKKNQDDKIIINMYAPTHEDRIFKKRTLKGIKGHMYPNKS